MGVFRLLNLRNQTLDLHFNWFCLAAFLRYSMLYLMIEMMYPVISLSYPLQTNLCQPCSHLILIQYCLENLEIKTTCSPIRVSCCIYIFLSLKWPTQEAPNGLYFQLYLQIHSLSAKFSCEADLVIVARLV